MKQPKEFGTQKANLDYFAQLLGRKPTEEELGLFKAVYANNSELPVLSATFDHERVAYSDSGSLKTYKATESYYSKSSQPSFFNGYKRLQRRSISIAYKRTIPLMIIQKKLLKETIEGFSQAINLFLNSCWNIKY